MPTQVNYQVDKTEQHFLDAEAKPINAALKAKLPSYEINIQSVTKDEQVLIVATTSDRTPGSR